MRTLDELLEPLLGLDGEAAPLAGPLRDRLRAVVTALDAHLDRHAPQASADLYLRGQSLIDRFRTIHRVPGRGLHHAVTEELADPESPLRVPLWTALGDLAGHLVALLHLDGPPEPPREHHRLALALVGTLLGLTHPEAAGASPRRIPGGALGQAGRAGRERGGQADSAARPRGGPADLAVRLRDEYDRLYQDTAVYLGEPDPAPGTAEELWIALHVACLRLPGAIADSQRQHFAQTFAGAPEEDDDGVVPPLPAIGFPGLGGARGQEDDRWRSPRAAQMYDILAGMFTVTELDAGIHHGLDEMARDAQAPIRLDVAISRQYQERAWTRLRELDELQPGSDLEIRYLTWVDEVVSSFFPLPLPAPASWWALQYRRSRSLVLEAVKAAGGKADVEILDRQPYDRALRRKLSGTQMVLPVEEVDADRVLWTLRLPWQFNGAGEPGRVIHGVRRR